MANILKNTWSILQMKKEKSKVIFIQSQIASQWENYDEIPLSQFLFRQLLSTAIFTWY